MKTRRSGTKREVSLSATNASTRGDETPVEDSEVASKRDGTGPFGMDWLILILSAALLVAMGAATLYHFRYAIIDETVMPGRVTLQKDGKSFFMLSVEDDEDLSARVLYRGMALKGRLRLAGAETDTVLYRLVDAELFGQAGAEGLVLYVRVPRSGLQGDLTGPWMTYFSLPAQDEKGVDRQFSDWVIVRADGTALVGSADNYNAMTALRRDLEARASAWTWDSPYPQTVALSSPEPWSDYA